MIEILNLQLLKAEHWSEKIIDFRPVAIIDAACERDIVAGIKDVAPKFSVLGVNNERPLGLCRNTVIDPDVLKEKINFFLGTNGKSIRQYHPSRRVIYYAPTWIPRGEAKY